MLRVGVDIGGTFTDFAVFDEAAAALNTFKLLTTAADPAEAVLAGLGRIAGRASIVHGSTIATNAVLERKGAKTALVTTRGFRDVLSIARQNREDLYDFLSDRPEPLIPPSQCHEVSERVDAYGRVIVPLSEEGLVAIAEKLRTQGIESVAVCLLHSYMLPEHERGVGEKLRALGMFVSLSTEILPEFREYERTSTTALNAYVSPLMDRYLSRLEAGIGPSELRVMQSNGGSLSAKQAGREGVRAILSGPAGGVVGAWHLAQQAGCRRAITFDMGGTSTDVSLLDGGIQVTSEAAIGGLPFRIPTIGIHTIGAGGGSIAAVDVGGLLRVGPRSAGADPGPVCYGRGGQLPTVTDANLCLGRLVADHSLAGEITVDAMSARRALERLARQAGLRPDHDLDLAQVAALGIARVVNAHMMRAVRVVSIEKGHDPRDYVLISFGGSGGLHACELARAVGIQRVLVPRFASTLSAFGMLTADVVKDYVQTVLLPGEVSAADLERRIQPMRVMAQRALGVEGFSEERIVLEAALDVRYVGQSYELTIPYGEGFRDEFHKHHSRIYGHCEPEAPVEVVNLRLRASGLVQPPALTSLKEGDSDPAEATLERSQVVLSEGQVREVDCWRGEGLRPGNTVAGPGLVLYPDTTIFLPEECRAVVDRHENLVIDV